MMKCYFCGGKMAHPEGTMNSSRGGEVPGKPGVICLSDDVAKVCVECGARVAVFESRTWYPSDG